jgi:simple sugar transport system ATP-binding protein
MRARDVAVSIEVTKRYGRRQVLRHAQLVVSRGSVHAIVGENGAGKSTLVGIVAGTVKADFGRLQIDGEEVELQGYDCVGAIKRGVGLVHQHGVFASSLRVVENAAIGHEVVRRGWLRLSPTAAKLRELGDRLGLGVDPQALVADLPVGVRQRAEILSVLLRGARILILDEPTAVLTPPEVEGLFSVLRTMRANGGTVILVTHKLDEVTSLADDVTVLRAGESVARFEGRTPAAEIARCMVRGELPPAASSTDAPVNAAPALVLRGLSAGERLKSADLTVGQGEIVGVAGVDGNGQSELLQTLAGSLPVRSGTIELKGCDITKWSIGRRLSNGLASIPEDREKSGLVLDLSVAENLALARSDVLGRWRIDRSRVAAHARAQINTFDIRPPDGDAMAGTLSGGNQQKVVVARELSRPNLVAVLAAHPTRGADIVAATLIRDRVRAAAGRGAAVLIVSADLDELFALSHRIVVMLRGRINGALEDPARSEGARARIARLMTGSEAS